MPVDPYVAKNTGMLDPTNPNPDPLTSIQSILDSPQMRRERMWNTIGNIGMALIQAGAPSRLPNNGLAAVGAALNRPDDTEDRFLRRAMLGSQMQKNAQEVAAAKEASDLLKGASGAPATPSAAAAAPPTMPPSDGTSSYYAMTGQSESGGNPTISNGKGSGAYGTYQFMPQTWANVVAQNPQLGLPADIKQATPEQQQAAMEAFTKGNAQALTTAGFQPTPANLYLAHRFGADGARTFLSADPSVNISSLFPNWIAQNPDLNTTVGQFRQGVEGRYAGVPSPAGQPTSVIPVQAQGGAPAIPGVPTTMRGIVQQLVPAERQGLAMMLGLPGGQAQVMNYLMQRASPDMVPMLDQQGRPHMVPKNMAGKVPGLMPLEVGNYQLSQQKFDYQKRKDETDQQFNERKFQYEQGKDKTAQGFQEKKFDYEQNKDASAAARAERKDASDATQQAFSQEKALRSDFESQPAVKSYRVVVPMLESAKDAATRPTRAADLNLIYAFAKLMDPDSVVRESETAGVVATASVAERLQAYIGQLNGQAMLNPDMRRKLIAELESRFHGIKESHDALAKQYTDIAKAYNVAPERVVIGIRQDGPSSGNAQPSQEELNRWAAGDKKGAKQYRYVPGKGLVEQ